MARTTLCLQYVYVFGWVSVWVCESNLRFFFVCLIVMAARTYAKIFIYFTTLFVSFYFELHTIGWRLPANRNIYKLCILLTCVCEFTAFCNAHRVFRKEWQKIVLICGGELLEKSFFNMRVRDHFLKGYFEGGRHKWLWRNCQQIFSLERVSFCEFWGKN